MLVYFLFLTQNRNRMLNMYYDEKEIIEHLKCPYCQSLLDDPRILPCGASICNDCSVFLAKKALAINCKICSFTHEMPETGFTKNQNLAKLVELKPYEISRGKTVTNFKSTLDKLANLSRSVHTNLINGTQKLRDTCNSDKIDIQLARQLAHTKVDIYCDEFLEQIQAFEKENMAKYKPNDLETTEYAEFIRDTDLFGAKWSEYLKSHKIDKCELRQALVEGNDRVSTLKRKASELEYRKFGAKQMRFDDKVESLLPSSVGVIKCQNVFYAQQIDNLKHMHLPFVCASDQIEIEAFHDENFFVAYKNAKENINLAVINSSGAVLSQVNDVSGKSNSPVNKFKLFTIRLSCYIYVEYEDSSEIQRYDSALNLIQNIYLDRRVSAVTSHGTDIYSLWFKKQQTACLTLSVMGSDCMVTEKIGQNSASLPFYFPADIRQLEVNEKFFILLDKSAEISFMSRVDGVISHKFAIRANAFRPYLNRFIIEFDRQRNVLSSYELDGKLVSCENVAGLSKKSQLVSVYNEKLVFYDAKENNLYF